MGPPAARRQRQALSRTRLVRALSASAVLALAAVLGSCGFGDDGGSEAPATTAAADRVAPLGAPYSFAPPAHLASVPFLEDELRIGTRVDQVSAFGPAGGAATLSVLALWTGEPLADTPAALAGRVWRELGTGPQPAAREEPLGGRPGFALTAGDERWQGAAVGEWVVLLRCSGEDSAPCDGVARSLELRDAPPPTAAGAARPGERAAPYAFTTPDGFTATDSGIVGVQLGTFASLVTRSWQNRVIVFASTAGREVTHIDGPSFCRVMAKVIPRSTVAGRASTTVAGRETARCDATALLDAGGRELPGLQVEGYGLTHETWLVVVLCSSTAVQRAEARAGCDAVLRTLTLR